MAKKKIHTDVIKNIRFVSEFPCDIWATNTGIAIDHKKGFTYIPRFKHGVYNPHWWRDLYRQLKGQIRIQVINKNETNGCNTRQRPSSRAGS